MAWLGLVGHDAAVERFRRAIDSGRLASTFLFVGPEGIGKRRFALQLAKSFLCERSDPAELNPCGQCPACQQVAAGTHPDLDLIAKPEDRSEIPVALLIGDAQHRMRAGLCYNISMKPASGRRRIAILDDADALNEEGANCLLKTLEEPPPGAILILIGTSAQRQLPTIRSRSQIVRFSPLTNEQVAQILIEQGLAISEESARYAAELSGGSVAKAVELVEPRVLEFRKEFLSALANIDIDANTLAKSVAEFIDEAGKEGAAKRARFRQVVDFASTFYRAVLLRCGEIASPMDRDVDETADRVARWWIGGGEGASHGLERCLDATLAIDSNGNQATTIDAWLDDLSTIHRTGYPPTV